MPTMYIPSMAQRQFVFQGFRLTPDAAEELQAKADGDPTDIPSGLQLLGYYHHKSIRDPALRDSHLQLAQWVVTNYPESEAAGSPAIQIHASRDPAGCMTMKHLWLKQVEAHSQDANLLGNAANFFLLSVGGTAEEFLLQAQKLEPNNERWAERLGDLYKLGLVRANSSERPEIADKALVQFELAMSQNKTPEKESVLLVELAKVAFEAGQTEKAKTYADQLLKTGSNGEKDWNSGNAVHIGNTILGRLAIATGDVDAAKSHLLAAGKTTGSPQLNSFGPNMQLAKELLEKGEKDVVLEYFELCGKFWKNDNLAQ